MEFSRQEYWNGLPFASPGDLPEPGIQPQSPALQADSLPSEPPGKQFVLWIDHHKVNQHLLQYLVKFFFSLMAFKICSLSNFQIYNTVLLTTVTKLYIVSLSLIYFITGSFYLLTPLVLFPHPSPSISDNYRYVLCIYKFAGLVVFKILHIKIVQYLSFCLTYLT